MKYLILGLVLSASMPLFAVDSDFFFDLGSEVYSHEDRIGALESKKIIYLDQDGLCFERGFINIIGASNKKFDRESIANNCNHLVEARNSGDTCSEKTKSLSREVVSGAYIKSRTLKQNPNCLCFVTSYYEIIGATTITNSNTVDKHVCTKYLE